MYTGVMDAKRIYSLPGRKNAKKVEEKREREKKGREICFEENGDGSSAPSEILCL